MRKKISLFFLIISTQVFLNEHNFFNLNQKIFVLIPKNREFNSLQENKKNYLFKWFLKIQ